MTETAEVQLAQVRGELEAMRQTWELHTQQDHDNFEELKNLVHGLDERLDQLQLNEAERRGEATGTRRAAAAISSLISLVIGALSFGLKHLVG